MLLNYMISWSIIMMILLGLFRLRSWYQVGVMGFLSWAILTFSWLLANRLADGTGLDLSLFNPLAQPDLYVSQGPAGWLILLVVPIGWLAPLVGANVAERLGSA